MNLDKWYNAHSGVTIGSTGPFGTPRGWIGRAVDEKLFNDSASLKTNTTLDHREISCGAIFPRGITLPDFGKERVLYRFFYMPKGYTGTGGGRAKDYHDLVQMIGVALAIKPDEFLKYERVLKENGAIWLYFNMPTPIKIAVPTTRKQNVSYDYEQVYAMLKKGMKNCEIIAQIDGASDAAISYIRRRWKMGLPPTKSKKLNLGLDHNDVVESFRGGESAQSIADRYNATRQGVYGVLTKYGIQYKRTGTNG